MNKSTNMILLALFIGCLFVSIILTFVALGFAHPVPWLLVVSLVMIPILLKRKDKANFAVWKDEYSVGIDVLDDDHRKLLNLINKFQTAVQYQTGEVFEKEALTEVIDYTKYHFEREEKMMEEAGYDDIEAHKKIHQSMIAKIDEFMLNYDKQGHLALQEVAEYLQTWLVEHINGTDQDYSAVLKKMS